MGRRGHSEVTGLGGSNAPPDMSLPNLLIIGAAKAGTTSLHEYLNLHPSIFMTRVKELRLFSNDDWRDYLGWYRGHFSQPLPVRGESSPPYTMHPWFSGVAERAAELVPEARLIYLVRDPVDRLLAQYVEHVSLRLEHRPIAEALADFDSSRNRFVTASRYAYQLDRWRDHYPDDRILVLDHADLLRARPVTLQRAFGFLGVDTSFSSPDFERIHNPRERKVRANPVGVWLHRRDLLRRGRSASRGLPQPLRERLKSVVSEPVSTPVLEPRLRAELQAYLSDDADRLRVFTGQSFATWSV